MTNSLTEARTKLASTLVENGCVKISFDPPFTHTTGLKAPTYFDLRFVQSIPLLRGFVTNQLLLLCSDHKGLGIEGIASVHTGGITHGILLAERLELPHYGVRKRAKKGGSRIDGKSPEGKRLILIEDTATSGMSIARARAALTACGATVVYSGCIFAYDPDRLLRLQKKLGKVRNVLSLADFRQPFLTAGMVDEAGWCEVERWLADREGWDRDYRAHLAA